MALSLLSLIIIPNSTQSKDSAFSFSPSLLISASCAALGAFIGYKIAEQPIINAQGQHNQNHKPQAAQLHGVRGFIEKYKTAICAAVGACIGLGMGSFGARMFMNTKSLEDAKKQADAHLKVLGKTLENKISDILRDTPNYNGVYFSDAEKIVTTLKQEANSKIASAKSETEIATITQQFTANCNNRIQQLEQEKNEQTRLDAEQRRAKEQEEARREAQRVQALEQLRQDTIRLEQERQENERAKAAKEEIPVKTTPAQTTQSELPQRKQEEVRRETQRINEQAQLRQDAIRLEQERQESERRKASKEEIPVNTTDAQTTQNDLPQADVAKAIDEKMALYKKEWAQFEFSNSTIEQKQKNLIGYSEKFKNNLDMPLEKRLKFLDILNEKIKNEVVESITYNKRVLELEYLKKCESMLENLKTAQIIDTGTKEGFNEWQRWYTEIQKIHRMENLELMKAKYTELVQHYQNQQAQKKN